MKFDVFESDINSAMEFCNKIYNSMFSEDFDIVLKLSAKLSNDFTPISDKDLERILTDVPLMVIHASESVSKLELSKQVIKLKMVEHKSEIKSELAGMDVPKSEYSDIIKEKTVQDELSLAVYSCVLDRVNREISYSRELIMSAKKIWDRRRQSENFVPNDTLPEYRKETYIK